MEISFPEVVRGVAEALAVHDVPALVVGGALRDLLLGRPARDFDLVVEGSLEQAAAALPEAHHIDARAPVLLLPERRHGVRIEISSLRGGAESFEGDLRLRDFTINAIACDPLAEVWRDPLDGRGDLAARRLRACDPARGFKDDAVRILRGARLERELGLTPDPETLDAMGRAAWRLAGAAGERLRAELFRLLSLPDGPAGFRRLRETGALAAVLPELLRGVAIGQNRRHVDDVYTHTLKVCAELRPEPVLRLAALLHDVAKPETKAFLGPKGDVSFHRHEQQAAAWINRVAARLRLSRDESDRITRLVRHHLLLEDRLRSAAAVGRMLRRVGRDILPDLLELRRADLASRGPVPESFHECEARIRARLAEEAAEPELAIGGEDVMTVMGVRSGPGVGRWLARARRRVTEHPEHNTRESLLAWLRDAALRQRDEE